MAFPHSWSLRSRGEGSRKNEQTDWGISSKMSPKDPYSLMFTSLYRAHPRFSQFGLCNQQHTAEVTLWHIQDQVMKKTSTSVLGAHSFSSLLPLWEAVMYADTQAAYGEAHLRIELRPADNHTSEFGNGSFSPLEPWDDCIPGQCVDCTFISWKIRSRLSS